MAKSGPVDPVFMVFVFLKIFCGCPKHNPGKKHLLRVNFRRAPLNYYGSPKHNPGKKSLLRLNIRRAPMECRGRKWKARQRGAKHATTDLFKDPTRRRASAMARNTNPRPKDGPKEEESEVKHQLGDNPSPHTVYERILPISQ